MDIIKLDYEGLEGEVVSDSWLIQLLSNMTKHTKLKNISIRDLSINHITDLINNGVMTKGESARAKLVCEKKRLAKLSKKYYHTCSKFSHEANLIYSWSHSLNVAKSSSLKESSRNYSSISKTKVKDLENILFTEIKSILYTEGFNEKTQVRVERLVFSYIDKISSNVNDLVAYLGGFDSSIFSNKLFLKFLFTQIDLFDFYVKKLISSLKRKSNSKKTSSRNINVEIDTFLSIILQILKVNDFRSALISCLLRCITYYNVNNKQDSEFYLNTEIHVSIEIGKQIVDRFVRKLYKEANLTNKYRLSEFKKDLFLKDEFKAIKLDDDEVFANIGFKFLNIMYEVKLLKSNLITSSMKEKNYVVCLSDEVSKLLKSKIFNKPVHMSLNLPMIVKPKDYVCTSDNDLTIKSGGYFLNNDVFIQPLVNYNNQQPYMPRVTSSKTIDTINSMMKVSFKINTELLDYLIDNYEIFLKTEHPLMKKAKLNKREERELQSYTSQKILEENILLIANTFRDAPEIYFPLMLDFRGRIYNKVTYLNYQGSELAKALILFARPCYIFRKDTSSIEYLKAYAAACYGKSLDKKSYKKKLE